MWWSHYLETREKVIYPKVAATYERPVFSAAKNLISFLSITFHLSVTILAKIKSCQTSSIFSLKDKPKCTYAICLFFPQIPRYQQQSMNLKRYMKQKHRK